MISRVLEVLRRMAAAKEQLASLEGRDSKYTVAFFSQRWDRQREVQQDTISANSQKLKDRMNVLMDLEEKLLESRYVGLPLQPLPSWLAFLIDVPTLPNETEKHWRRWKPSQPAYQPKPRGMSS